MSLGQHLASRLRMNALCGALLVGSFALVAHVIPSDMAHPDTTDDASTSTSRAGILIEQHDCWTGEAPADMQGVIPGHVVVTRNGETVYGGSRLVGKALEQIFDSVDHGLTVHAFCR